MSAGRIASMLRLDGKRALVLLAADAGAGMTGACVAVDRGHRVSSL